MTEEVKRADAATTTADADAGEKLDKILECVDSLSARMDDYEAEEKKRMEGEEEERKDEGEPMPGGGEELEDEAREEGEELQAAGEGEAKPVAADNEEEEGSPEEASEEEAIAERGDVFADAFESMADALTAAHREIAALKAKMPKQLSDADYAKMADAQARADNIFNAFGQRAPRALDGETLLAYRRRMATALKKHSPAWGKVDLVAIADSAAFDNIEAQIYTDAMTASKSPTDLGAGELRAVVKSNPETGIRTVDFVGNGTFIGGMGVRSRRAKLNMRPNAYMDR